MTFRCPLSDVSRSLLAGLLALVLVSASAAQGEDLEPTPYGQRTDAFRRLLFELHFQPLKNFTELHANPSESVLIVLGDSGCLAHGFRSEGLRSFVRDGGAVLIATDKKVQGRAAENLIELAGVTVSGETLLLPNRTGGAVYDGSQYCPFVEPIRLPSNNVLGGLARVFGAGGRPALFRNPYPDQPDLRVATNAPSRLEMEWPSGGIYQLARLPAGCRDETTLRSRGRAPRILILDLDEVRGQGLSWEQHLQQHQGPLFAVGGSVGKGGVLVLADHSIFINRMILPRDNGNLEFTANCLHWLRGGAATPLEALGAARGPDALHQLTGQRDKALFVDDGLIQTDFRVPMREARLNPPPVSEPAIVAALDQTLAKMEDNDAFDQKVRDTIDFDLGRQRVGRFTVYLLTLAAVLQLGYRFLWRGRYRTDAAVPLLEPAMAHHEPRASLLEQRRRAMLRCGNVWETIHQLARESFESAGIPLMTESPPRMAVRGNWWRRWRVRRRIARLWKLARGTIPARIPPAALKRWLRELDEMKTDLERMKDE